MKNGFLHILSLLFSLTLLGQSDIDVLLKEYNDRTVPYISVKELAAHPSEYVLLDTRKKEEFEVSHIPKAIWAGETLEETAFAKAYPDKNTPIVVYCSVGVRSEDFGEQLLLLGYNNVKNLYGSIFAWKDAGNTVINAQGNPTDSVHVFSKMWEKYLTTGKKVY